jgi:hypothetical protein
MRGAGADPVKKFEGQQWTRLSRGRTVKPIHDEAKVRWSEDILPIEV